LAQALWIQAFRDPTLAIAFIRLQFQMSQDLQTLAGQVAALDEQSAISVICSVLESRPELAPSVVNFAVPELTYPPIKALVERRSTGYIKSFNEAKGFGFIACQELMEVFGNDVFVVGAQMSAFPVGSEVSFAVALNKDNKPQAYDLREPWPREKQDWSQSWDQGQKGKGSWAPQVESSWSPKGSSKGKGKSADKGKSAAPRKGESGKGEFFDINAAEVIGTYTGMIKSFNEANGYGFISCEDLKKEGYHNDVFLHHAQLNGNQVGSEVVFAVFLNAKGQPQAKDLEATGGQGNWKKQRQS